MAIDRYAMECEPYMDGYYMARTPDGSYVTYEDHTKIISKMEHVFRQKLKAIKKQAYKRGKSAGYITAIVNY